MFLRKLILCSSIIYTISVVSSISVSKRDTAAVLRKHYGGLRDNCFPRPRGGCECAIKGRDGREIIRYFDSDEDCKLPLEVQTLNHKIRLNKEIRDRYGRLRDDCFPRPSGGCTCNEEDSKGNTVIRRYDDDIDCKMSHKQERATADRPSSNVRDPVRERAQANYRAVINELNEKFKGLKEGCFPRPKGCLCVIGKDRDGRDITERRMKDRDCKCQPGERGHGCPAEGA